MQAGREKAPRVLWAWGPGHPGTSPSSCRPACCGHGVLGTQGPLQRLAGPCAVGVGSWAPRGPLQCLAGPCAVGMGSWAPRGPLQNLAGPRGDVPGFANACLLRVAVGSAGLVGRRGQTLTALLALDMRPDLGSAVFWEGWLQQGLAWPLTLPEGPCRVARVTVRPAWEASAQAPGCTALRGEQPCCLGWGLAQPLTLLVPSLPLW